MRELLVLYLIFLQLSSLSFIFSLSPNDAVALKTINDISNENLINYEEVSDKNKNDAINNENGMVEDMENDNESIDLEQLEMNEYYPENDSNQPTQDIRSKTDDEIHSRGGVGASRMRCFGRNCYPRSIPGSRCYGDRCRHRGYQRCSWRISPRDVRRRVCSRIF